METPRENYHTSYRSKRLKYPLFALLTPALVILFVELLLRVALGYPRSLFDNITSGLYPKNDVIVMTWGPIPYTVRTNSLGLRGPDFALSKPDNTFRIVTVGDSVTAGFFVDNEDTYPRQLEGILNEKTGPGKRVEVINVSRGGGTIDKELALIKKYAAPLDADMVLLTFVDNDIAEVRNKNKADLVSMEMKDDTGPRFTELLFTRTAIGELLFDMYLRNRSRTYRAHEKTGGGGLGDRYNIHGGDDFARNVEINKELMRKDGTVFEEPFPLVVQARIDNYLFALKYAANYCREKGVEFVFVYYPSYIQVYEPGASMKMRDILETTCRKNDIPFIDLTPIFRREGRDRVLHLAPVDFHPNPDGYGVIARGVADYLIKKGYLM